MTLNLACSSSRIGDLTVCDGQCRHSPLGPRKALWLQKLSISKHCQHTANLLQLPELLHHLALWIRELHRTTIGQSDGRWCCLCCSSCRANRCLQDTLQVRQPNCRALCARSRTAGDVHAFAGGGSAGGWGGRGLDLRAAISFRLCSHALVCHFFTHMYTYVHICKHM